LAARVFAGCSWVACVLASACGPKGAGDADGAAASPGPRQTEVRRASEERVVQFPAERSLGWLFLMPAGAESAPEARWAPLGPARGAVVLPADARLRLIVPPQGADFAAFGQLDPDGLQELILTDSLVGDEDLEFIAALAGLQGLDLSDRPISDGGLARLAGLARLQWLDLSATRVRDAGLVHLRGLSSLRRLSLRYTQVSDVGLVFLKELPALESLDLSYRVAILGASEGAERVIPTGGFSLPYSVSRVTDAAVEPLIGLPALRHLYLEGTQISLSGLGRLARQLPGCAIRHSLVAPPGPPGPAAEPVS